MAANGLQVLGVNQLVAKVNTFVARKALRIRQVVAKATLNIRTTARHNAPVSKEAPRGTLKNSITAVLPVRKPEGAVVVMAPYGPFVELGTGRRGAASNQQRLPAGYRHGPKPGMAARPFLRPALDAEKEKFAAALKAAMRGLD